MIDKKSNIPDNDDDEGDELGLAGFHDRPGEQGLSLDQLSGAFAELFHKGTDPYAETAAGDAADPAARGPVTEEDPTEVSPLTILEALLFVGSPDNAPLSSTAVAGMMRGVRAAEVDDLVRQLNERYAADQCPYEIAGTGAGYRLVLREAFVRMREKFYGKAREVTLTQPAIETLALVAYNQPLTRDEVNKLRGRPSGSVLTQLVRRQLLRLERPETKPRTPQYFTTERFLQLFGLTNLEDLPRSGDELE